MRDIPQNYSRLGFNVGSDNVRRDAEGALKMAVDFLVDWMM
jgi:hypothetical protein